MFEALGRFTVRHRWLIIAGWLVLGTAAVLFLPSLGSVIKNDNAAFLPADAPSVQAAHLAAPFLVGVPQTGTMVVVDPAGPLTAADQAAVDRMAAAVRGLHSVTSVRDLAESPDLSARTVAVQFVAATGGGGSAGAQAVGAVRGIMAADAPPGAAVYFTGPLPQLVDQQSAAAHTANRTEIVSGILVLLLLFLAFRAVLAPLVTLAPPVIALAVAGPVIALSTHLGVQISSLMQLLLTALVLGAGTDYGLFLLFRYREYLKRGLPSDAALIAAVAKVGKSVVFSAATVVAALLSLLLASFGLYRGVGPGLALGIVVVLALELTFFPAVLSVLGRASFWPAVPRPGAPVTGRWGRLAGRVSRRPLVSLLVGTAVLGTLALALLSYAPSGFDAGGYIAGSNSSQGNLAIEQYFGLAAVNATDVVIELPRPAWDDPQLVETAGAALWASGRFSSVQGPFDDGGPDLGPQAFAFAYHQLGPPGDLPAVEPPGVELPSALYSAYRSTAASIANDGRLLLYRTSLRAGAPSSTAALQAIPAVRASVAGAGRAVGAVHQGVAGQAAAAADVSTISAADVARVAPVVLLVLTLILAILLRSLVAPLYLVASVGLSYLASLGLAVLIFVVAGHQLGINFTLPFFMFVFIMALGEDYNILVMTRIRDEAAGLPLREAVAVALGTTGTTVTSAGLVLAGTFAVLAATTSGQVRQIGVGLALGILLDTFVVRTLLVPSAVVVLGRWNWWPSRTGPRPRRPLTGRRWPGGPRLRGRRGAGRRR